MKLHTLFILVIYFIHCNIGFSHQDSVPPTETMTISSKILGENRVINIWFPENSQTEYLPVIFMLDGGVHEDFTHVASTISRLIESKQIRPHILVGIENTQRRRDLTGSTTVKRDKAIAPEVGGSALFRSFIQEELFPAIEKRFGPAPQKTILGESLAGLFVVETFLLTPELFDNYIAFDPSMWWNKGYLANNASDFISKFNDQPKKIWFASSNTKSISSFTNQLSKTLDKASKTAIKWNYSFEPKEQHSTIFRAMKEKAFIWTLSN